MGNFSIGGHLEVQQKMYSYEKYEIKQQPGILTENEGTNESY